jgi:hypothetical protein
MKSRRAGRREAAPLRTQRQLYGVEYPRPSHLLLAASTGFDMPVRAVTVYERDGRQLDLGGDRL